MPDAMTYSPVKEAPDAAFPLAAAATLGSKRNNGIFISRAHVRHRRPRDRRPGLPLTRPACTPREPALTVLATRRLEMNRLAAVRASPRRGSLPFLSHDSFRSRGFGSLPPRVVLCKVLLIRGRSHRQPGPGR